MKYNKENLLASISGSKEAFSKLYEEIYTDLYKMAYYLCGSSSDAEDVVSEAVLDAYKGIRKLKSAEKFDGWMIKILSTKAKRKFKHQYNSFSNDNPLAVDMEKVDVASTDFSEKTITQQELIGAMGTLKQMDRLIILLCIVEGYQSSEVGELLSMNASSVRSRLNRSLKKMKNELEGKRYE